MKHWQKKTFCWSKKRLTFVGQKLSSLFRGCPGKWAAIGRDSIDQICSIWSSLLAEEIPDTYPPICLTNTISDTPAGNCLCLICFIFCGVYILHVLLIVFSVVETFVSSVIYCQFSWYTQRKTVPMALPKQCYARTSSLHYRCSLWCYG